MLVQHVFVVLVRGGLGQVLYNNLGKHCRRALFDVICSLLQLFCVSCQQDYVETPLRQFFARRQADAVGSASY